MSVTRDLHISGIVQGVGFRPFVYRQAARWGLAGWVLNATDGVHIHLEGDERSVDGFIDELPKRAPAASHISSLEIAEGVREQLDGFLIRASVGQEGASTLVSPDIATCPACLRELFDRTDRRFHYPFINCTNCGPRFTIIGALPYDRPSTSMSSFAMCPACEAEYGNPLDRRFHAQPDACFDCGPSLSLWEDEAGAGGASGITGGAGSDAGRTGDGAGTGAGGAIGAGRGTVPCPTALRPVGASNRALSDALIERVARLLIEGRIVALKGLGGYHLACDATNEHAVATLRARKRRPAKPFALMVGSVADAQALCQVSPLEAALLGGTVRPIVLLERLTAKRARVSCGTGEAGIAPSVTGGLHELGIMLPATPVQHLLMDAVKRPLVMTSGNISEEPIIAGQDEAHTLLGGVADAFLDNDREILSRYDDSVTRVIDGRVFLLRRARGYAPRPVRFPGKIGAKNRTPSATDGQSCPAILAVGPEQKNTFCYVRGEEAFVSQHLGDLENASSFAAWLNTLDLYRRLFGLDYRVLTCDRHPEYLSTKWARSQSGTKDRAADAIQKTTRIEVQHHHAHIASILAEQCALGWGDDAGRGELIKRVIGIAFDGTGLGDDGTLWGGEVLIATLTGFERFAHLRCVPLPGGRAAIDHPNRMAWSYMRSLGLAEHPGAAQLAANIGEDRLLLLDQIIKSHVNTPLTSSMGRLFDAISALAGICTEGSYEGQAAIELEAALYDPATGVPVQDPEPRRSAQRYRFGIASEPGTQESGTREGIQGDGSLVSPLLLDPVPVIAAVLDDLVAAVPPPHISLRFHEAVVRLIADVCCAARAATGLLAVALSGGVFMNRYLLTRVVPLLESEGFTVLLNRELPANDGGISYGQAAVAAARWAHGPDEGII
ncbi:MAG: carbamoyltransferase HypF [Coriobacteriales bacterium]|jgi:hydrogenase maturation protein HypF|nr:carbamoyltransferase HypF [Coriobacteriales bacterium]